jgi:hypothetical protein
VLHADGALDLATPHFDRDLSGPLGPRGPVCQPITMRHVPSTIVRAFVNNEPIGPQSSVEEERDPERLAEAALVTWLAGGAAYTLHTGAGVRGGGAFDRARDRSANLWEVPNIERVLALMRQYQTEVSTRPMPTSAEVPGC